jgi:hypothetical protein
MNPSCAKSISDQVHSKIEWKQEKLVFCLPIDGEEDIEFDIVSYLGGDLMGANLTFSSPNRSCLPDRDSAKTQLAPLVPARKPRKTMNHPRRLKRETASLRSTQQQYTNN